MTQRLEKHGQWCLTGGENLSFGKDTAKEIVVELLIDDGDLARGHRENIVNPAVGVMGCFFGPHLQHTHMCTIDYCGSFASEGEPDPISDAV